MKVQLVDDLAATFELGRADLNVVSLLMATLSQNQDRE